MSNWLTRLLYGSSRPNTELPHFETRYVVVNTEASGLNPDSDRLLAVAALGIEDGVLDPRDSYYAATTPSADDALSGLLDFISGKPVVAFNADLQRALLGHTLGNRANALAQPLYLDLYYLLPALFTEKRELPGRLADWMALFDIETFQRHHALGDAWAIAQLFLAVQGRALSQGLATASALAEAEHAYRQLRRQA